MPGPQFVFTQIIPDYLVLRQTLVRNKFPKTTVLELLQQFVSRKDDLIVKTVTDNAPIPDIFEYVLGLAWYYISNKK
jgi:hypothetical protein